MKRYILFLMLLLLAFEVKALDNNVYLSSLSVDGYEISPKFDKYNNVYTLIVKDNINQVDINWTTENADAFVEVSGNELLSLGENQLLITVNDLNQNIINTYEIYLTIEDDSKLVFEEKREVKEVLDKKKVVFIILGAGLLIFVCFKIIFHKRKFKKI